MLKIIPILILIHSIAVSEEFIPNKWRADSIPAPFSKKWDQANESRDEFEVKFERGKLWVDSARKPSDNRKVVEAETLLAVDQGEWGGGLYQYFKNKGGSRIIRNGNFHTIFDCSGKTYVLESDYIRINQGKIWRMSFLNGIWHIDGYIDVKDSPFAYGLRDDKSIYLITTDKFLDVDLKNDKAVLVVENTFWEGMFPNSIAKESDSVQWIGMHGGILKIDRGRNNKMTWYVKKK